MHKDILRQIFVKSEQSICDVIRLLDKTGYGVVLVVDDDGKLQGTITDGDLRRGMLRGVSFESSCAEIVNTTPLFVSDELPREQIKKLFDNNSKKIALDQIPVLDSHGCIVDLMLRSDFMKEPEKDNIVVIMAGGLGSRLTPLTLDCPKPLLRVGNKPVLEILLESFVEEGFKNFVISVNYKADMIQKAMGTGHRWDVNIDYLYEDKRLGTAGPLGLFSNKPDKPFFVVNSDILTKINFEKLLDYHMMHNADATLCVREHEYVVPYGVVKLSDHRLVHIEEKPVHNCFVSAGIYVLSPSILQFIPHNAYFDMNELLVTLLNHSKSVNSYPIHEYWLDIGRMEDLERAHQEYQHIFQT